MDELTEYLTRGDVGKLSGLTSQGVLYAVKRGELTASARTRGGISLFTLADVEAFLQARRQAGKGQQQTGKEEQP